jgi:hypothetical protein
MGGGGGWPNGKSIDGAGSLPYDQVDALQIDYGLIIRHNGGSMEDSRNAH